MDKLQFSEYLPQRTLLEMRLLLLCLVMGPWTVIGCYPQKSPRAITVDYENDRFLKDGEPFRYISGSFHFFRATPPNWRRIIRVMKAAGLNALSTYISWSLHNPADGEYVWDGLADLNQFLDICKEEEMFVILRPGPYIGAERDFGGLPVWLKSKYPNMKPRTMDAGEDHSLSLFI